MSGTAEALDARARTESGQPTDKLVTDLLNRVTVMCGGEIADS